MFTGARYSFQPDYNTKKIITYDTGDKRRIVSRLLQWVGNCSRNMQNMPGSRYPHRRYP